MLEITLVLLSAGESSRFELGPKKQWLRSGNNPLWLTVANRLSSYYTFCKTIIVTHKNELEYMKNFSDNHTFIEGGNTRQESMKKALSSVDSKYVIITDIARACVPKSTILNLINSRELADCIVPFLNVNDTVVYNDETINRENVKLIQTPQLSKTCILKEALKSDTSFTDDSSAIKSIKGTIHYIKGSAKSLKLTFSDELSYLSCLNKPSNDTFVGTGIDIHAFQDDKDMLLGGIKLPYDYGFKAHSDGDVLIHSVIDAMLGAIGAGDIGEFFPDSDDAYKNIDSKVLLEHIISFVKDVGYEIVNVDLTILAEIPKINPHKQDIKVSLATLLNINKSKINIKATTLEKLGFIGKEEGIAVQSICTLKYYDWIKK